MRAAAVRVLQPIYERTPGVRETLISLDTRVDGWKQSLFQAMPRLIRPAPRSLFVALTANCNLRCKGCNYGRTFMPGHSLPLPILRDLLDDAKTCGLDKVRLYGGEPLLYKPLPDVIAHCVKLGLPTWITTNGVLLRQRIDALVEAGLRRLTIGWYGVSDDYNDYVGRPNQYERVEHGIDYVATTYGSDIRMSFDWLLMRPTCNVESLQATWRLARRYRMPIQINLIHYSLPYFNEGPNRELQFRAADRSAIERVVSELIKCKKEHPELIVQSLPALRAIPDWLIKGPAMRVPCSARHLIWVGADGTVQMCYVTFKLGNLHEQRLREMMFTGAHRQAARDAFALNCPNCHCGYDKRTLRSPETRRLYWKEGKLG